MKLSSFLPLFNCPACQSGYSLQKETLACKGCGQEIPIKNGVPDFVKQEPKEKAIKRTQKGFAHMWSWRVGDGSYQELDNCYGFSPKGFADWLGDGFLKYKSNKTKALHIIDVGCGSGEKVAFLARKFPEATVVGIDFNPSVLDIAKRYEELPNLQFVRADLHELPFKEGQFDFMVSIGVLHHTADTKNAFDKVVPHLAEDGVLMIWIYPAIGEDEFWDAIYFQRDILFAGQASRLAPSALMAMSNAFGVMGYFPALAVVQRYISRMRKKFPFIPRRISPQKFYQAIVQTTYDNLMPVYQYRHDAEEVTEWLEGEGLTPKANDLAGFFWAKRGA